MLSWCWAQRYSVMVTVMMSIRSGATSQAWLRAGPDKFGKRLGLSAWPRPRRLCRSRLPLVDLGGRGWPGMAVGGEAAVRRKNRKNILFFS
jgi:hypothetical protein